MFHIWLHNLQHYQNIVNMEFNTMINCVEWKLSIKLIYSLNQLSNNWVSSGVINLRCWKLKYCADSDLTINRSVLDWRNIIDNSKLFSNFYTFILLTTKSFYVSNIQTFYITTWHTRLSTTQHGCCINSIFVSTSQSTDHLE